MINNLKLKKYDWQKVILGIRKKLNLSQSQLSKRLRIIRQTISRFEAKQRIPNKDSINKILNFIGDNNLNINELIKIGNNHSNEYLKREKFTKLNLEKSKELAELIGIILGDGEIMRDGTIRISFDPKKDVNFLKRRVFFLIKNILNNKIGFESYKRIALGNIAFVRYLQYINLNPGSKFEHNWEIPKWCFDKQEYISAVIRGLFDTDGYFGYLQSSTELMFGRFSDKCNLLVKSIEKCLDYFNLKYKTQHTKDGRFRIRMHSKKDVLKFFKLIGSSNIKHIVRFLLWRIKAYEARIEIEGLNKLIKETNKLGINIEQINLPFFWNLENKNKFNVKDDEIFMNKRRKRNTFK